MFYPNKMFQQKDYQFFEFAKKKISEYSIESGDKLSLQVFSRDGFKLIDVFGGGLTGGTSASEGSSGGSGSSDVSYTVDKDGFVKLPVLGDFYVKGYSHRELENVLAQKYSNLFVDPYVIIKVVNRRVFLFKGSGGSVITLNESPTSLIEVLAKSGGVDLTIKAYKIKVIRGDLANPTVQIIDLSTLEGIRNADLTMQPNDIIYIEERRRIARDVLREISPIISGFSLIVTTIFFIKSFGK